MGPTLAWISSTVAPYLCHGASKAPGWTRGQVPALFGGGLQHVHPRHPFPRHRADLNIAWCASQWRFIAGSRYYSLLKLSVSGPLFQVRKPWLNVMVMGRLRKSKSHMCCALRSPSHPTAPVASSTTVMVVPSIMTGPLKGPHLSWTLRCRPPPTDSSWALTPPDAVQGTSLPSAVPERLVYVVHGLDGRNAAHVSCGGVVLLETGVGLEDVAELVELDVGAAVPGPPVTLSPQDVISMPRNSRGTV